MSNFVVQEVNILDVVKKVGRRNKRLQAVLLSEIEAVMGKGTREFSIVRKLVLDETNNYTRAVVRDVFGDIEYLLG